MADALLPIQSYTPDAAHELLARAQTVMDDATLGTAGRLGVNNTVDYI